MRTYMFQEHDSPMRGCNKRIVVHRIKRNQPHYVGEANCNTASWKGAHGEAVSIIHDVDGIPYAMCIDDTTDLYRLRGELGHDLYRLRGELGHDQKYFPLDPARNAVRLFGI